MALPSMKGGYSSKPPQGAMSANAKVGNNAPKTAQSSGKLAQGNPHVNLGTTHGNHDVHHPVKTKSSSTPTLGT